LIIRIFVTVKKALSIFLTFLVLISNSNLTFAIHYCGGMPVEHQWMIGRGHLDCGMAGMDQEDASLPPENGQIVNKYCCENHYQAVETDDVFPINELPSLTVDQCFIENVDPIQFDRSIFSKKPHLQDYSPPLMGFNLILLNQVFLL